MAQLLFSHDSHSVRPSDLPYDTFDEDEAPSDRDRREARYQQYNRLVDKDDIAEIVCSRFSASTQLMGMIEDCLSFPVDPDALRLHPSDAMRVALDLLREVAGAIDERIELLQAVED